MKPNIFMSYSRREVGFIDDLTYRLEKEGYNVWLDYRSLVPGTPWANQIDKGVDEADVILLVVSKASIASQYVELEWRRVIAEEKKRIILLIFEAVDLPPELEKYEWVDFREDYEAGIRELVGQVDAPAKEDHPAPETGFKVPRVVWRAFGLSLITALFSLSCLWSLFVPYFLLPLPYRIFKRDFNITQVQAALWLLPIVIFLNLMASVTEPDWSLGIRLVLSIISVPVAIALIMVLRSKSMQRWGKPEASLSKSVNRYIPEDAPPRSVSYFIDHAPEDQRIANDMTHAFSAYGHTQAPGIQSAQVVLVLLSSFKSDTEANPEHQSVLPVMVQTCTPTENLSKVQWVDLRRGVRNLEAMAKLLPAPVRLLDALGGRPTGSQLVLPPIIMGMRYFLILLGIFILGSIVKTWIEDQSKLISRLSLAAITLALLGVLLSLMLSALTNRKGALSSFPTFSLAVLGLGLPVLAQSFAGLLMSQAETPSIAEIYPLFAYAIGMPVMSVFLAFRYRDVRRWFPAKTPKP
ncbi:MAG: toll/interleukin-1 receptor domain-containing protein [Blastocatellia bacterium]|nr:toll/interleukin-1 receptor domain-containing protein [Blastocatellia bacterium]